MPSPFDITAASNTVTLDNNRAGVASFTAKNNTRRRIHATARLSINLADDKQPITSVPPDALKWLTIVPPPAGSSDTADSREFPIDSAQNYQVNIVVPTTAAPASYKIRLTLADEANPDDNFTDSPEVVFSVREIPKPAPKPFPTWIIPAVLIAIVVIVLIIIVGAKVISDQHLHATQTAVALTEEATLNAIGTQTALAPFAGSWIPVTSTTTGLLGVSVTGEDSGDVTIKYAVSCSVLTPPLITCHAGVIGVGTIQHVPFSTSSLSASDSQVALLITPSNNGQILVSSQIQGVNAVQPFKSGRFPTNVVLRNPEINARLDPDISRVLQGLKLPTAAP